MSAQLIRQEVKYTNFIVGSDVCYGLAMHRWGSGEGFDEKPGLDLGADGA